MTQKIILITGGAGYIGSHMVVTFEQAGYQTVTIDNLSNSSLETFDGIENILGYRPIFHQGDIRDQDFLDRIFTEYTLDGVIHLAGLKAVGESCQNPIRYYENNIVGSITLFGIMEKYRVRNIVFSSSATVYHQDNPSPLREDMRLGTSNPYGTTKLLIEKILEDLARDIGWSVISLRYFNPIGAHASGYIGERTDNIPNNLFPYIMDVAKGKRDRVWVYGNDYSTIDGTGVRDYIDICDLVDAHIAAYRNLAGGCTMINIGTGKGTSVLEMIWMVGEVIGKNIAYEIGPRRPGDIDLYYAGVEKAEKLLGWKSTTSLKDSIANSWKYMNQVTQDKGF